MGIYQRPSHNKWLVPVDAWILILGETLECSLLTSSDDLFPVSRVGLKFIRFCISPRSYDGQRLWITVIWDIMIILYLPLQKWRHGYWTVYSG